MHRSAQNLTVSLFTMIFSLGVWVSPSPAGPIDSAETGGKSPETKSPSISKISSLLETTALQELLQSKRARIPIKLSEVPEVRELVWEKYKKEVRENPARKEEHERKEIRFAEATMRFEYSKIGSRPEEGYPLFIALHGGGGGPARMNDGQWKHMTVYYRDGVKEGIYAATRGVSNTWNLHFRAESYPLYDRLIENMIIFEDVDPNRVYLLGYSAGGDGVYQITPRMADRWAAANMSAGHHNGVNPKNLYRVPFLLQVGELDRAYNRNTETVKFYLKLEALKAEHPDGYVHELFVHHDRPHNFRDNHPEEAEQEVLADPGAWLEKKDRGKVSRNTNAIAWLKHHRRDPLPPSLIWDLKTRADRSGRSETGISLSGVENKGKQFYWLDIVENDVKTLEADEVSARLDKKSNAVIVEKPGNDLRILLSHRMLDLSRPITIRVEGKALKKTVKPNLETMIRTVLERGDPSFIFEADCVLQKKDGRWMVPAGPRLSV